ncbi:hypothetical protein IGB42_01946 [Andreprevotia sp. IGB-42]|uniref:hypothetical protein n=1 Tax=Andreprevotia sp. IGB-42 TaxID=2497473 RepID=UPI00135CBD1D|nr:hypothetical protein [Andreprevotia sp. IGB-42]KAF0813595.1 hypothetical protein IGB42_01946 [Andreprevotia sp. IGB-42]
MKHQVKNLILPAALSVSVLLVACGGGSASVGVLPIAPTRAPTPTPTPVPVSFAAEGVWRGTTSNGRALTGVVLDNGSYWVLYSATNNANIIAGVLQGSAKAENGDFASTDGKDLNQEGGGVNATTIVANYVAKKTLTGTLTYPASSQSVTLTGTYDADYEKKPALATIAGTYSGTGAVQGGSEAITLIVSATGLITGTGTSGCKFTGTTSPHAKGNVYDVTVTFAGGACMLGTSTITGVGYYDASQKRLYGAALNTARNNGMIFVGTKP